MRLYSEVAPAHCHNAENDLDGCPTAESAPLSARRDPFSAYAHRSDHDPPQTVTDDYWASYPETLTSEHLAKILRIGVPAVQARLRSGSIPAHHVGRSWIIFRDEIRAWIAASSNRPGGDAVAEPDVLQGYDDEISYRELMKLFGKTKQTIYIWLHGGVIPASNVAGRWVVLKPQLRELLRTTSNQGDRQ